MKFSERKGLRPVKQIIQVDSVDDDLRNSIWNFFDQEIFSRPGFLYWEGSIGDIEKFSRNFWSDHLKKPADTRPNGSSAILKAIRECYFSSEWFEAYDFVEFLTAYHHNYPGLDKRLNAVLEREVSGYRLIKGHIVEVSNKSEVEAIESALKDPVFPAVSKHLETAIQLLSKRENPDFRNSVKESISAVEAMARIVTKNPKATLGDALKVLERNHSLHGALKDGFSKLYGYTSDEGGIRHAMLDDPNLTKTDAIYFLVSCSAFTNYLKTK